MSSKTLVGFCYALLKEVLHISFFSVRNTTPRLLINREKCGTVDPMMLMMGYSGSSMMDFDSEKAYR